jgi:hypothetical protein
MQGSLVKISGNKIGSSGDKGTNSGLTRVGRRRKVVDVVDGRTCPSSSLAKDTRRVFAVAVGTIGAVACD